MLPRQKVNITCFRPRLRSMSADVSYVALQGILEHRKWRCQDERGYHQQQESRCAEVTQLRRELRAENVDFKVYKNSLAQRAAEAAGASELVKDLIGPNAIAFGSDAVAPARVLAKFAKDHEALVLKSGIVEGKVVGLDTIQKLSVLPNREGMIAKFMGCLQSPVRKFAVALNAVKEQKESAEA